MTFNDFCMFFTSLGGWNPAKVDRGGLGRSQKSNKYGKPMGVPCLPYLLGNEKFRLRASAIEDFHYFGPRYINHNA